jgi:mRNA interferase RelE/StbE
VNYAIQFRPGVDRDMQRLPYAVRQRVDRSILKLSENPRPVGCQKLSGADDLWRVRVGDYRIVYEIDDRSHVVELQIVAHRREVYRGL